jgi:hypothetical protein
MALGVPITPGLPSCRFPTGGMVVKRQHYWSMFAIFNPTFCGGTAANPVNSFLLVCPDLFQVREILAAMVEFCDHQLRTRILEFIKQHFDGSPKRSRHLAAKDHFG